MAVSGMISMIWHQKTFKPRPLPPHINLAGQTAMITGSNVGLGFETAQELALHGVSHLILAVRDISKGETAKAAILKNPKVPAISIEVWKLDQESWPSIVAFGERAAALPRLDMALLNAGVKFKERRESQNGHESMTAVNHLGTALLSLVLFPVLRRTTRDVRIPEGLGPSRLTFTSSSVAFWIPASEVQKPRLLEWLDNPASFSKPEGSNAMRYSVTKLLSVFWIRELAAFVSNTAKGVRDSEEVVINYLNPGYCMSEFHRSDPGAGENSVGRHVAWSAAQGGYQCADALVLHPNSHGCYLSEMKIRPEGKFVASAAGKVVQRQLWDETMAVFRRESPGPYLTEYEKW
ncbi:NAD(P)-binding protein [Xylariaceae sp. FL0255]|nr:NAD(P)-binding protein [Xylariaceae sp. FL0255]